MSSSPMVKYKLVVKASVRKDLKKIPKRDVKRILSKIEALAINPRGLGCTKLSGEENYRVRQGMYRIVYQIRDSQLIVNVIKVGHRSNVYNNH